VVILPHSFRHFFLTFWCDNQAVNANELSNTPCKTICSHLFFITFYYRGELRRPESDSEARNFGDALICAGAGGGVEERGVGGLGL
jgi:hypothetical protein